MSTFFKFRLVLNVILDYVDIKVVDKLWYPVKFKNWKKLCKLRDFRFDIK